MTETLLNTKIVHEATQSFSAQTGDNSWLMILLFVAIISGLVAFKKKFVKALLSFCLVFSFVALIPAKSFADESVTITSSAEVSQDNPANLTITNNSEYTISISSFEITNSVLPDDTTWDIDFVQEKDEITDNVVKENICFDISPHTSFTFTVYPNIDEIPWGKLCDICFRAVSTHYKATYINNDGDDAVSAQNDFDFSFSTFENADPTKLNREISISEALFASIPNTYNNIILGNISYDISDRLAFMRTLGFEDNIYCKLWPDQQPDIQADPGVSIYTPTYTLDKNDVTSFCFNHRKINFGNHYTEIINISVGATGGSFEWASNFDYGASKDTDYWNATGDHPEWKNLDDHKGFDIAKNRLLSAYNSYYSKYIDNNENVNKIILVNGHSRGGAIANLLGKHFENLSATQNLKTFIYTFASPNTTSLSLNNAGNTIFNIINRDDLVSQFPGYISGFYKYGKDIELSVFEDNSINGTPMETIFKNMSGYGQYNGNDPDDVQALIVATCDLIESREDAYTLAADSSKVYTKLDGTYDTPEAANKALSDFQTHLNNYNLQHYANPFVEHDEFTGSYIIKFKCCAAFIMQDIANFVFIYGGNLEKYQPSLGYNTELINVLLEALGVIPGIVHSHVWMSYNLLAKYDQY